MNKPLSLCLLLLAVLWASCPAAGQRLRLFYLPTQRLLPVAQIHDIIQDDEGYMWYATPDGLCRDNGYQIDVFRPGQNDGGVMHDANILCLRQANPHTLLFGTAQGLYALDKRDYTIRPVALPAPEHSQVDAILVAHDGTVWVSVKRLVVHLDRQLKVITSYADSHAGMSLYEDRRHRIWHPQWQGGLSVIEPGSHRLRHMAWQGAFPTFMTESDSTDVFWVGTFGGGIVRYNSRTGRITPQSATLGETGSNQVIHLLRDNRQGLLWSSTMSTLDAYRVSAGSLERVAPSWTLPSNHLIIDRLFADRGGNLWVSGFSPQTFILAPDAAAVSREPVDEMQAATGFRLLPDRMIQDTDGYYWIWQGRYGLCLYRTGMLPIFLSNHPADGLAAVSRSLVKCRNAAGIWAAAGNTYYYMWREGTTMHAKMLGSLRGDEVTGLGEDHAGRLWVQGKRGLSVFTLLGRQQRTVLRRDLRNTDAFAVGVDAAYVVTADGVTRVGADGTTRLLMRTAETVSSMAEAPDGSLWIGTHEGRIYHSDDGHVTLDSVKSSRQHNAVKQLAFDSSGHLWVLFDQSVSQYDLHNNARQTWTADNADVQVDYFFSFSPQPEGMGVGGAGAYCIFPSLSELAAQGGGEAVPRVSTVITAEGESRFPGYGEGTVSLSPHETSVTLCLCTPEHLHASNVTFAYRVGDEGPWTTLEQGQNRVYLNNLSKGRHRVYVRATNRFGNWGQPRLCLTLRRLPAWYETWWAYVAYVLMAAGIVYFLVWLNKRIRYLDRLQQLRHEMSLKQISMEPEDISAEHYNAELMKQLLDKIESHLSDPSFNVAQLSDEMNMSRVNLYRKTKELTGKNPTELLKEIRLKHAAAMLREDNGATVADIAAKVGFATPSYFSKCFKEMFGTLPNDYRGNNQKS